MAVYGKRQMLPNPTERAIQESRNSMPRPHFSRSFGSWGSRVFTSGATLPSMVNWVVVVVVLAPAMVVLLLPMPTMKNIRKNRTEKSCGQYSNFAIASGYAMNVSPGPSRTISWMLVRCVTCAKLPRTPNTMHPTTMDVNTEGVGKQDENDYIREDGKKVGRFPGAANSFDEDHNQNGPGDE
uniref:Uncharacterized protein n=1 Tax=Anopheles coluzzii TaxID=1518534 RepID=A0A8W7PAC1_ANOCL